MSSKSFLESLKYAVTGIAYCIRTQRNMRIHLAFAVVVLIGGIILQITPLEYVLVVMAISAVLVCEVINTAVERAVDTAVQEYHPTAKIAKDVAAGAVLVAALSSVIVGFLIFGKYLWAIIIEIF